MSKNKTLFNKYGMMDMVNHQKEWDTIWDKVKELYNAIQPIVENLDPSEARLVWNEAGDILHGFACEYLIRRGINMRKIERGLKDITEGKVSTVNLNDL